MQPRWTDRWPRELVVYDAPHPCPYIDGRRARLPMRLPSRALSPAELDQRLAEGDRRHGPFLYRPRCPSCAACEAIRIPVDRFTFRKSHRRVLNRGDRELRVELGDPVADAARLELYERHKRGRDLVSGSGEPLDLKGYEGFLVDRCVDAFELRFHRGDELIGVAVTDRGEKALSAVYCFWNPSHAKLSLGTYSILKHLELPQPVPTADDFAEWVIMVTRSRLLMRAIRPSAPLARKPADEDDPRMSGLLNPLPDHCPSCGTSWKRVKVKACDKCGARGIRSTPPCSHLRRDHGRWILHENAFPWTGGREGYYCMGCSHPPR